MKKAGGNDLRNPRPNSHLSKGTCRAYAECGLPRIHLLGRWVNKGLEGRRLSQVRRHGAGVRPWRRITSASATGSGGPSVAASTTAAISRGELGVRMAGVAIAGNCASGSGSLGEGGRAPGGREGTGAGP